MTAKYGRYMNLKAELARKGVTQKQAAEALGIGYKSLNMRVNGKVPFTAPEIMTIRNEFAPDATLDYLMATEK